jgi:hypothetical protein
MITKMKSVPASQRYARILLSAWNTGDLPRLRETLMEGRISAPEGWPLCGAQEQERMEMLATIADALRNWLRRGGDAPAEDLHVSLRLLRHLAGCEPIYRESAGHAAQSAPFLMPRGC